MDGFPFNFRQDRSVSLYPLRLRQPRILCRVLRLSTRPCPQPFPTSMPPPLVSYAFRSSLSGRRGRRTREGINFCGTMAGIIFIPRRVFPAGLNISKSRAIGNNRIFHATSALNYRAAFRFYGPRSTLYDQLAPREIQPNYIGGTKGRRGIVVINTLSPNRIYIPSNFLPA